MALFVAGSAAAAEVDGVWLSPSRSAHVQISHCGSALCGKVISASQPHTNPDFLDVHNKDPALRSRRVIGVTLLEGFTGGPTEWAGGHVYNPGDGNTYSGKLTLIDDNHLKLTGCALWVLCKSQVWTRLD
ncbi:MAG TPA: DUF2147 domain-containing protein [Caulobacteraceae bacterium]